MIRIYRLGKIAYMYVMNKISDVKIKYKLPYVNKKLKFYFFYKLYRLKSNLKYNNYYIVPLYFFFIKKNQNSMVVKFLSSFLMNTNFYFS